jgi:type VI secretion system secreted protein VgrG
MGDYSFVPTPEFTEALNHMLEFEGGYANVKGDSGGETFRGISRRNWPKWSGWPLIDRAKADGYRTAKAINAAFADNSGMRDLVACFYHEHFWSPWARYKWPSRLTAKVFDTGVNVGTGGAARILQNALNSLKPAVRLKVDGALGPLTLDALDLALNAPNGLNRVLAAYADAQADYYRAIVRRKPSQAKFLTGWLRRAAWLPK